MKLELDPEKINMPLSLRERLAVYILLAIFSIVVKPKYQHELDRLVEQIGASIAT